MITLNDIIEYYNGIRLMDGNCLREDVFLRRLIFEFCKDLHTSQGLAGKLEESWFIGLEKSKTQLDNWNTAKNEINKYFKSFGKVINVSFKDHPELVIGHYIESLYAFERSIFWFFNYKYNLDPFNQVASEQALYYSEFFSIVTLTRFLGGSLNHTPLGLFKLKIDWENKIISIHHRPSSRSSHGSYKDLFFELLDSIDFSNYGYLESLKVSHLFRKKGFLMIEDRMENVYDLSSRMSDPFKNALHRDLNKSSIRTSKSWNFLEGLDELYSKVGHNDYDGDLADYLHGEYSDDGYRQHHIGEYWKFLIYAIKKINNTEKYTESLIWKLNRFEGCDSVELDKSTKDILINWMKERI